MGLEVWAGCSRKNLRADARVQPRAGGDIERYEKPFAVVLLVASVIWIRSARRKQTVAALTVILLLGFSLGLQGFATAANFLDLLRSISKLGILGLGMGLIVISRGIDLSEVAMMAGSWCVALTAIPRGLPPFWAAVLALTICVAVGLFTASWSLSLKRRRCSSRSHRFDVGWLVRYWSLAPPMGRGDGRKDSADRLMRPRGVPSPADRRIRSPIGTLALTEAE